MIQMNDLLDSLRLELSSFDLELITKPNGREGVGFLIGDSELYLNL